MIKPILFIGFQKLVKLVKSFSLTRLTLARTETPKTVVETNFKRLRFWYDFQGVMEYHPEQERGPRALLQNFFKTYNTKNVF